MADMLERIRTRGAATPQSAQADPRQVPNSAGGWAFAVSGETRIRRFLTMGTYGTYYATAQDVTADSGGLVLDWAKNNSTRLTELVTEISVAGRAPRQGPALLALAAALSLGDTDGRRAAARALPAVVRTGSHLETWVKYMEQFGGWGPLTRRAVASWYLGKDPDALAYQLIKYRQRDGWSHADILKLAHPKPRAADGTLMAAHDRLFAWVTGSSRYPPADTAMPAWITAYELARDIERSGNARHCPGLPHRGHASSDWTCPVEDGRTTPAVRTRAYVQLIRDYPGLPWEALPDEATSQADVWRALIDAGMPVTALLRNLPKLTRLGVLAPMSAHLAAVCARLRDGNLLRQGRVHPISVLLAARTYASGRSEKGTSTWTPVPQVLDALDDAFYAAFGAVEPSGKRTLIALDISGSMGYSAAGTALSCREVTAAMSLVTMATEPSWGVYGFSHQFVPLQISPKMRLDTVTRAIAGLPFGRTDCALPMIWAQQNRVGVDTVQVWTDNETWAGSIHPHQALENYRQATGIPARLQVVAITPTSFSIADPDDAGSLDVSGFDASVPVLLADHAAGRL